MIREALLDAITPTGGQPANPPSPRPEWERLKLAYGPPADVEARRTMQEVLRATSKLLGRRVSDVRKRVALSHPILFGKVYFPEWFPLRTPEFHWEMATCAMRTNRVAVAAPIGSGKTKILTQCLPVWSVFAEPIQEVLLISNSGQMASGWLDELRIKMSASDEMLEDFGKFKGQHWGSEELEMFVTDASTRVRRVVVKARGRGCAIRGLHPDRIILDDPQDEESLKSVAQIEDFEFWLKKALIGRLDTPDKKLTYVATCIQEEAYIVSLIESPLPGWVVKCYAALDDDGKSLWPEKWDEAELERRRMEIGEEHFRTEYLNRPARKSSGRVFQLGKLEERVQRVDSHSFLSLCLDPSFTEGGDQWAFTLVEQNRNRSWHVHEAIAENSGPREMLDRLFEFAAKYPDLDVIGIEKGSGGGNALPLLIEDRERLHRTWLPISWIVRNSKRSKQERIELLGPLIETGRMSLAPSLTNLRTELLHYRTGGGNQRDNLLDSLAMHLEVQVAKRPYEPKPVTREQEIHDRYVKMEAVAKRLAPRKPLGRYDRYLPGRV